MGGLSMSRQCYLDLESFEMSNALNDRNAWPWRGDRCIFSAWGGNGWAASNAAFSWALNLNGNGLLAQRGLSSLDATIDRRRLISCRPGGR
ncbi:unnamed protein product [Amoebophrya sp. A120]|nr:unnamed protein product [Amoebophrya sp. A120]|eukprot:GSA120T00022785001.1